MKAAKAAAGTPEPRLVLTRAAMGKGQCSVPIRVLFASPGVRDFQSAGSHPRGFASLAAIEDTKSEVPPIPGKAARKRRPAGRLRLRRRRRTCRRDSPVGRVTAATSPPPRAPGAPSPSLPAPLRAASGPASEPSTSQRSGAGRQLYIERLILS